MRMTHRKQAGARDESRVDRVAGSLFIPFDVTRTSPLADAVETRVVRRDESVVVLEPGETRPPLIFVTSQLTYHHIAQGELAGEPFVVTF